MSGGDVDPLMAGLAAGAERSFQIDTQGMKKNTATTSLVSNMPQ